MRKGKKVLTISSDLQIYLDENGKPGYSSRSSKPREIVESEVQQWQLFVADWLEAHEPPKRERKRSPQELQFLNSWRSFQKRISKMPRRVAYPATKIEGAFQSLFKALGDAWGFTPEDIDGMLSEVFGTPQQTALDVPPEDG